MICGVVEINQKMSAFKLLSVKWLDSTIVYLKEKRKQNQARKVVNGLKTAAISDALGLFIDL